MVDESRELFDYCLRVAKRAKAAADRLGRVSSDGKNGWLRESARSLRQHVRDVLAANARDVESARSFGLTEAQTDRLALTPERIEGIAAGLEAVASLPDPIGETIEGVVRPNGLRICKVRVPLGVVFFIYESRPNVTADAAAICVKSGNAVILRGGKEAAHSSHAIVQLMNRCAAEHQIPEDAVQLVETPDREAVGHFLRLPEYIDLAIPRGGEGLIRRVAEEARMPVIKHFHGNCHVYVDQHADLEMAERIVINAKCQRMGVCNAAESLVLHAAIAPRFLPQIGRALIERGVEIRGDATACQMIPQAKPATEEDYRTEYLGPMISVVVVPSLDDAIRHINAYGSGHTDAIVTDSVTAADAFTRGVDSSAVMVNASTRFNDGGQFGLGAEIGISTDKFHARGPCGLKELTSYKYIVYGEGHVR